MKEITVGEKHTPKWWQWYAIKAAKEASTFSLIVSRQEGKSWMMRTLLADFIFRFDGRKNPSALVMGLTVAQIYDICFSNMYNDIFSKLPQSIFNKQGDAKSLLRVTIKRTWLEEPDYITIEFCGAGSGNAIRGRTKDFVLIDEAAFVPSDTYFDIVRPTVAEVGGKIFLTSTVDPKEGPDNWFIKNHKAFKIMNEEGDKKVNAKDWDVYTAQHKTDEWIRTEKEVYTRAGKLDSWLREFENNYMIALTAEAPFSEHVHNILDEARRRGTADLQVSFEYPTVFVNVDIGKPGNNPVWCWVPHNGAAQIIDYKDDDKNQYDVIDRLVKQYPNSKIHIFYPDDIEQPAIMEGVSRLQLILDHIANNGYSHKVEVTAMAKTKNRAELVRRGVEIFKSSTFLVSKCREGLEKLAGVRMRVDKTTGHVSPKDFVTNGYQHAGDGFIYISAALDNYAVDFINNSCYNGGDYAQMPLGGRSLKYHG